MTDIKMTNLRNRSLRSTHLHAFTCCFLKMKRIVLAKSFGFIVALYFGDLIQDHIYTYHFF